MATGTPIKGYIRDAALARRLAAAKGRDESKIGQGARTDLEHRRVSSDAHLLRRLARDHPDIMRRLIQDDHKAVDLFDQARQNPPSLHTSNALYNIQGNTAPTGTSLDATIRRLRKHHPELHARWLAGELSANAAAIEAGFRKRSTPLQQVERLFAKLSKAERRKLWRKLQAEFGAGD